MSRRLQHLTIYAAALIFGCCSCISTNDELGSDLLPLDQQYDTFTASFPIDDIEMRMADSLSGYSQKRITIGSIRDPEYGLTRRAAAVTLVPCYDSLDFGDNPKFESFRMTLTRDTMSLASESDRNMLQNVNVYALEESPKKAYDINALERGTVRHGSKRITKGIPVFNGTDDTLGIDFSTEYGTDFMNKLAAMGLDGSTKAIDDYLNQLPGIYLETSDPIGNGGRIDMFELQLGFNTSYYYLTGNYAELKFTSTYSGKEIDTSFLFYFCADSLYSIDSLLYYGTAGSLPQYCLNISSQETRHLAGPAADEIYVEGAGGIKPVISAKEIRGKIADEIARNGGDPGSTVLNKVSLVMPFEFPDDYRDMERYPQILSPTCRVKSSDTGDYAFANITDYSNSYENQGDVDRSNLVYRPDITYHAQMLLGMDPEEEDFSNYDIWFLIMYREIDESSSSSAYESDQSSYYNSLMYANYYNNMMYGGYGYSSYGYGYNSYSNYYAYMLMQSMYGSSSSSSVSYTKTLDKDRFYHAKLYGPSCADEDKRPHMEVTYSVPKVSR